MPLLLHSLYLQSKYFLPAICQLVVSGGDTNCRSLPFYPNAVFCVFVSILRHSSLFDFPKRLLLWTNVRIWKSTPIFCVRIVYRNLITIYCFREWFLIDIYKILWRRVPESNRCTRICNPLHNHSTNPPRVHMNVGNITAVCRYFKAWRHARGWRSNPIRLPRNFFCERPGPCFLIWEVTL